VDETPSQKTASRDEYTVRIGFRMVEHAGSALLVVDRSRPPAHEDARLA